MSHSALKSRSGSPSDVIVVGHGALALTLNSMFRGKMVISKPNETELKWPRNLSDAVSFIFVAEADCSVSEVIRQHAKVWRCPHVRQARCVIVMVNESLLDELLTRDVFGRTNARGETFADWANYIRLCPFSIGIAKMRPLLNSLKMLPMQTWTRKSKEASIVPDLVETINSHNISALSALLARAKDQDWDAICPDNSKYGGHHQYANCIRKWLNSVTPSVTPSWKDGFTLFSPLL